MRKPRKSDQPPPYTLPPPKREEGADAVVTLVAMLTIAVPLWIEKLRAKSFAQIQERATACADVIAETGDVLLFRGGKEGQAAEAFNRTAEGVACLSFAPGGVTVLGLHFETVLEEKPYAAPLGSSSSPPASSARQEATSGSVSLPMRASKTRRRASSPRA